MTALGAMWVVNTCMQTHTRCKLCCIMKIFVLKYNCVMGLPNNRCEFILSSLQPRLERPECIMWAPWLCFPLQVVLKNEPVHPFGLAVYGDYIFWTDWVRRAVLRADKYTGGDMKVLRADIPQQPMGIVAVANDSNSCEFLHTKRNPNNLCLCACACVCVARIITALGYDNVTGNVSKVYLFIKLECLLWYVMYIYSQYQVRKLFISTK